MFCQYIFSTKTLQKTFAKVFFAFVFCFVEHKSVKIFDVHIMWLAFINYKHQIYRIFRFLIWNVDWESQFLFITKNIHENFVFCFNSTKIFFWYRKFNSVINKIINNSLSFRVILSVCIFTGLICLTWHQRKHFRSLFLMLISLFFEFLNLAGNFA